MEAAAERSGAAAARRRGVRPLLANLALAGATLGFGLGILELVARSALRREPESVSVKYTEPDPVLGWRHRPGARARFGSAELLINSRGLRDVERPLEPPPGVERLLVLGDSFAEGFSVNLEDAVPRVLERELRTKGCPVEVVGGGTVGYSTDQQYLFYRDEGATYGPRVVVLLFYYNDVLYNARGAAPGGVPKPLFTFMGGTARVKNYPLPPPSPAPPERLWRGSAALTWSRQRLREGAPGLYDALARLRFWSPIRAGELPMEMRIYEREPPEPVAQAWLQTSHLLRLLAREAQRRGARLMIAYVPSKMEVSQRDWELTRRRYELDARTFDRGRLARLLEDVGRRLEVPVLDLTDALWNADRDPGKGPYFAQGGHWNALGHSVAARAIAAEVGRRGWLACRAASP